MYLSLFVWTVERLSKSTVTGTIRLRRVKREIGFIQDLHTLSPSPNIAISAADRLIGEVVQ